jgi:hypothetical protein
VDEFKLDLLELVDDFFKLKFLSSSWMILEVKFFGVGG